MTPPICTQRFSSTQPFLLGINPASPPRGYGTLLASMDEQTNQFEPGLTEGSEPELVPVPDLLTVSQAYEYLITKSLPRSKKTIRKWCRLNHVERKQNVIPGGSKWLITKSSLDARIAEERLIDASLTKETGSNQSAPGSVRTGSNPSAPVRDDELVKVLKQQLVHERDVRKATEENYGDLVKMYHEISMASTQVGIEIGKGMQEQGRARQLEGDGEPGSNRSQGSDPVVRTYTSAEQENPHAPKTETTAGRDHTGDNPNSEDGTLHV